MPVMRLRGAAVCLALAAVEVRWPSGAVDVLKDVAGRLVIAIREGDSPVSSGADPD